MDKIKETFKMYEQFRAFSDEYPDADCVMNISGPFFSLTYHILESFSDQKLNIELIVKKKNLQSEEDEVLFKKKL